MSTDPLAERTYTDGALTSKDGTSIGYRALGEGPGVVLVQGGMGTQYNYDQLARALSSDFTVFLPERRGRGMSPCVFTPEHCVEREVEDLDGLLQVSGAHFLFGLSSGAVITLAATRALPAIHRAAVYEPPFYLHGMPRDLVVRFNREITEGNLAAAMVTVKDIVQLAPGVLDAVPRPMMELAARGGLFVEAHRRGGAYASLRELVPSMRFDFQVVAEMSGFVERFRTLDAEVLLLSGTKSPPYLHADLDALQRVIPKVQRVDFEGLDHMAPWNADRGGSPSVVAGALRRFFRGEPPR